MTRKPVAMEISDVRKRVRSAIEQSRRAAVARRAKIDAAGTAYRIFLEELAGPVVQMLANALRAEGFNFTVFTPNGGLRLASARSPDDFIEFALDSADPEPFVALRVNESRGRRVVQRERPVKGRTVVEALTEEDVLAALLEELGPFVER